MKAIITGADEVPVASPVVQELVQFLVSGDLTDTGWQYSDYVDTTTADEYVEVATIDVAPPLSGKLIQAIFELCASIRAVGSASG